MPFPTHNQPSQIKFVGEVSSLNLQYLRPISFIIIIYYAEAAKQHQNIKGTHTIH